MRLKMIAVFTVVVLIVGGVSYALTRATVSADAQQDGHHPRALAAGLAQLQVEGLVLERWLGAQAVDQRVLTPFNAGTEKARREAATEQANRIAHEAKSAEELTGMHVSVVLFVDMKGEVLGRDKSKGMRGDKLGDAYPRLLEHLKKGIGGSDVWVNRERNEQLLVSYAPVRGGEGQVVGGIVTGTTMNDERLTKASDLTSGRILAAAVPVGDDITLLAKSSGAEGAIATALESDAAKASVRQALKTGQVVDLGGLPDGFSGHTRALEGYGTGKQAALISVTAPEGQSLVASLLWPALGVILLGFVLVVIGAHLLDAYISRPIAELEDGLLAIMNGKADLRFEIEHAELGGLVFRINSLLNQLYGVQEDDTDEQGRPSHAPTANDFTEALSVDETMAESGGDPEEAKRLREEEDEAYYARIFTEYVKAKRSIGDPTDHITQEAFVGRIMASEREISHKHGKPVRYKVDVKGKEVMLLAVPLA